MKEILYNGYRINYNDQGKGIPVVLLHGYLETKKVWKDFADILAEKYRVVTMDIPGHGKSEVIDDVHTMDEMARVVNSVLDELEIDKCILIGHSMGGYITMAFLEYFPERLLAFSLFHSTPFADNDDKKKNRDREIKLVKAGKKESIYKVNIPKMFADDNVFEFVDEIDRITDDANKIPDKGIVALLEGMKQRTDRSEILKNTQVPFLLVMGKKDNYIPYDIVSDKIGIPRNITKLILEKSGHIGFIEEKEKSVLGIMRFIEHL